MAKKPFYADGVRVAKATLYARETWLENQIESNERFSRYYKDELRQVRRTIKDAEGDTET